MKLSLAFTKEAREASEARDKARAKTRQEKKQSVRRRRSEMTIPPLEINLFHFTWLLLFMLWAGVTAPDTEENRTFARVMGYVLGITGIFILGIWIGQR